MSGAPRWIVLLAHGSRDARWRLPFETLRDRVASLEPGRGVALAYLQHCEPTLAETLTDCMRRGGQEALVVPVFMSGGGHLQRDVLQTVDDAASKVPDLRVRATGALAEEPEVVEAMAAATCRLARSSPSAKR
jgi:sirohydrochlorin cobaltochelatase